MAPEERMAILQLLLLVITSIDAMPDDMCFLLTNSTLPRPVLNKTQLATERACKVACGDNPLCTAVSYKDLKCTQLGAPNSSITCTGSQTTVQVKTTVDCPVRVDPKANFGNDNCITALNPADLSFNKNGICPRNSQRYVIRGIDEFGNRVTLDNDIMNVLSFNSTRNMWKFYLASADFTKWLVAVSCANALDNCCTTSLYNVEPPVAGQSPVQNNGNGACADTTKRLTFFGGKYKPDALPSTFSAAESATMTITCQAGIWLMNYLDNRNGWAITNATCVP